MGATGWVMIMMMIMKTIEQTYVGVISFKIPSSNASQMVIRFSPHILGWYNSSPISLLLQFENAVETCTRACN